MFRVNKSRKTVDSLKMKETDVQITFKQFYSMRKNVAMKLHQDVPGDRIFASVVLMTQSETRPEFYI